jgi:hypothetical protein
MGGRLIQSFCSEWEDVTRFQLPEGIQQQVRVNVHSLGEAREWDGNEARDSNDERVDIAVDDGVELRSVAHPHNPMPLDLTGDLVGMYNALPANNQEIIAAQIRANYTEYSNFGVGQRAQEHLNELRAAVEEHREQLERPIPPVPEGTNVWDHILSELHGEVQRVHDLIGTVEVMRAR